MSAPEIFQYQGQQVRTVTDENGQALFVLNDVCAVLGIANPRNVAGRLDPDMRGVRDMDTPGGRQTLAVVTEPGLYSVIMRSNSAGSAPFRRWVTAEVLPTIRRTGSYGTTPALSGQALIAAAVIEAQAMIEAQNRELEVVRPKADAFDEWLSAAGSYSVGDAAKILTRVGIEVGQNRLFKNLDALGWTFRKGFTRHVNQRAAEQGLLTTKPQAYTHPKTGERVLSDPQIRVTTKGMHKLRDLLQAPLELEEAAA